MVDAWAASTHRGVACKDCHGSSLSADLRMHAKNLQRVWLHSRGARSPSRSTSATGRCAAVERCCGLPRPGVRRLEERTARRELRRDLPRPDAQREPAADGRLPALPRHALRGRDRATSSSRSTERARGGSSDATLAMRRPSRASPATRCIARGVRSGPAGTRPAGPGVEQEIARPSLALYDRRALEHVGPRPASAAGDARRRPAGEDEPRPAPGPLLPVPRSARRRPGRLRRRPHARRRPRGVELPGLPPEARPDDARLVRRLPPATVELRHRRGDDGHHLPSRESRHDVHRVSCVDCHPGGPPKKKPATAGAPGERPLRP